MSVLTLDRVTKRFGDATAVDELPFAVREGEVFGFQGGKALSPGERLYLRELLYRVGLTLARDQASCGSDDPLSAAQTRLTASRN